MSPLRPTRAVASLVALSACVWTLHRLGTGQLAAPPWSWEGLRTWAATRDAPVAILAAVRLLALGVAWYLVAVTAVTAAAVLVRSVRGFRWAQALTAPALRPLIQRMVRAGLRASPALLVAPAVVAPTVAAAEPPPAAPPVRATEGTGTPELVDPAADSMRLLPDEPEGAEAPAEQGDAGEHDDPGTATMQWLPAEPEEPGGASAVLPPAPEPSPPPDPVEVPEGPHRTSLLPPTNPAPAPAGLLVGAAGEDVWVVAPGDHLWSISEETLADEWGRAPSDDEVAGYWEKVVAVNRSTLADPGNPDLVFSGQVVTLPPVPIPTAT